MNELSVYILTKNSEKHLADVLSAVATIADEIIVVDSGSTDATYSIVAEFPTATIVHHEFKNYVAQREYAVQRCSHEMVFFVDSDEVPNAELLAGINKLKNHGFTSDAYCVARTWNAYGRPVHGVFPVVSPDYPVRLFNKSVVNYNNSTIVHETLQGYSTTELLPGSLNHRTFETQQEVNHKLQHYTNISAEQLVKDRKRITFLKTHIAPIVQAARFYLVHKGILDGVVGIRLAWYAYQFEKLKFLKARKLKRT